MILYFLYGGYGVVGVSSSDVLFVSEDIIIEYEEHHGVDNNLEKKYWTAHFNICILSKDVMTSREHFGCHETVDQIINLPEFTKFKEYHSKILNAIKNK